MSKKSCLSLHTEQLHKNGQDFLDILYTNFTQRKIYDRSSISFNFLCCTDTAIQQLLVVPTLEVCSQIEKNALVQEEQIHFTRFHCLFCSEGVSAGHFAPNQRDIKILLFMCFEVPFFAERIYMTERDKHTVHLQSNIIQLELKKVFDVTPNFNYINEYLIQRVEVSIKVTYIGVLRWLPLSVI